MPLIRRRNVLPEWIYVRGRRVRVVAAHVVRVGRVHAVCVHQMMRPDRMILNGGTSGSGRQRRNAGRVAGRGVGAQCASDRCRSTGAEHVRRGWGVGALTRRPTASRQRITALTHRNAVQSVRHVLMLMRSSTDAGNASAGNDGGSERAGRAATRRTSVQSPAVPKRMQRLIRVDGRRRKQRVRVASAATDRGERRADCTLNADRVRGH
jgi:hypothetical protein